MANRNADDEKVLIEIAKTNVQNPKNKLIIYDARSWTAAQANRFKGGGLENTKYYTNCEIQFCDIDNIHAVRDAINDMYKLGTTPGILNNISKYQLHIEQSNWF